jgi:hypothetical protein
MIDGHKGVLGDGVLAQELEGVLVQLLERYLALTDYKSKFYKLSNYRGDADPRSRSHLDLDARYKLPLVFLPVALVDGEEYLNLKI